MIKSRGSVTSPKASSGLTSVTDGTSCQTISLRQTIPNIPSLCLPGLASNSFPTTNTAEQNRPTPLNEPLEVRYFRLTFPEPGKIFLKVGPGDHTQQIFELTRDQLRGLILDALPELLR